MTEDVTVPFWAEMRAWPYARQVVAIDAYLDRLAGRYAPEIHARVVTERMGRDAVRSGRERLGE